MIVNKSMNPTYMGLKFSDNQIKLINEICSYVEDVTMKNPIESQPYYLDTVLKDTPVYIASLAEQIAFRKQRFEDEEETFIQQLLEELETEKELMKLKKIPNYNRLGELNDLIGYFKQYRPKDLAPLGWFEPGTQCIKICLDAIKGTGLDFDTMVVAVTLHELAHAMMYNENHPSYANIAEYWLEESLANKVMLKSIDLYNSFHPGSIVDWTVATRFVRSQPLAYKAGLLLYITNSSDWYTLQQGKTHINLANGKQWMSYVVRHLFSPHSCKVAKLNNLFDFCFKATASASTTSSVSPTASSISSSASSIPTPGSIIIRIDRDWGKINTSLAFEALLRKQAPIINGALRDKGKITFFTYIKYFELFDKFGITEQSEILKIMGDYGLNVVKGTHAFAPIYGIIQQLKKGSILGVSLIP